MKLISLGSKASGANIPFSISEGGCFGGCLVSADGTNAASIKVADSKGNMIMDFTTTGSGLFVAPFYTNDSKIYVTVSGTGATAQFFEWMD